MTTAPMVIARYAICSDREADVGVSSIAEEVVPYDPPEHGGTSSSDVATLRVERALAKRYGIRGFLVDCGAHDSVQQRQMLFSMLELEDGFEIALCWSALEEAQRQGSDPQSTGSVLDPPLGVTSMRGYLRVQGRPLVVVEGLDLVKEPTEMVTRWRDIAREQGDDDLYVVALRHEPDIGSGTFLPYGVDGQVPAGVRAQYVSLGEAGGVFSPEAYLDRLDQAVRAAGEGGLVVIDSWNSMRDDANPGPAHLLPDAPAHLVPNAPAHLVPSAPAHLVPSAQWGTTWLEATAAAVVPARVSQGSQVRQRLFDGRRAMSMLEHHAAACLAVDELDEALSVSAAAADWACHQTALWSSPELEETVSSVGRLLVEERPAWRKRDSGVRSVAHVLTEAVGIGGHTRLAWRWIAADSGRTHTVILTSQSDRAVPEQLSQAVDGRVVSLRKSTPTGRVRELAKLLVDFDMVALHIHPYDVTAVAACADRDRRPPVVLVNHADHLFWLGATVVDHVVNIRPSAEVTSQSRRGIDPSRMSELPLPLGSAEIALDRAEAKRELGLAPDALVMLTMASRYKYAAHDEPSFMTLVASVLERTPAACLVAVGPDPADPRWSDLAAAFPGRVLLLGEVGATLVARSAAEIYLDSYPFASITSLLETAALGIPAVCFQPHMDCAPMYFDDPGVHPLVVTDADEWLVSIRRLVHDGALRRREGEAAKVSIAATHEGEPWQARLEQTYERVLMSAHADGVAPSEVVTPVDDARFVLHERAGIVRQLRTLLDDHGLVLPDPFPECPSTADWLRTRLDQLVAARNAHERGERTLDGNGATFGRFEHVDPSQLRALAEAVKECIVDTTARELGGPLLTEFLEQLGVVVGPDDEGDAQDLELVVCSDALSRVARREQSHFVESVARRARFVLLLEPQVPDSNHDGRPEPIGHWVVRFARHGFRRHPRPMPDCDGLRTVLLVRTATPDPEQAGVVESIISRSRREQAMLREELTLALRAARHQQHLTWLALQHYAPSPPG